MAVIRRIALVVAFPLIFALWIVALGVCAFGCLFCAFGLWLFTGNAGNAWNGRLGRGLDVLTFYPGARE